MQIKNEFIHIWTREELPVLFAKVSNVPAENVSFELFMEEYLHCVKALAREFPLLFTITDFSEISPPQLSIVIRFYVEYIPVQLQLGIRYKAFVRPRNLFSQFALEDVIKNTDPDTVGVFNTFDEALTAIQGCVNGGLKSNSESNQVNDSQLRFTKPNPHRRNLVK